LEDIETQALLDNLYFLLHSRQFVLEVHLMQLATLHEDNNGLQVTPWVYSDEYPNTQVLQMAALLHEKQFEINELHKLQVP
jgi:hypothetical protein